MIDRILKEKVNIGDGKLVMSHFYAFIFTITLGLLAGLIQTLIQIKKSEFPFDITYYYQVFSLYALVFGFVLTTYFILGFQLAAISRTAGPLSTLQKRVGWIGFSITSLGTAMAAFMFIINETTVLFDIHPLFSIQSILFLGLILVVVGSWVSSGVIILAYINWKKNNPNEPSPLLTFMVFVNSFMWIIATLEVVVTILFHLLPSGLGIVTINEFSLSKTFFPYYSYTLVYFWLLSAYMAWYVIIPKVFGGKFFSDSLARSTFILFLLFSVPFGFHHKLVEPGMDPGWENLQLLLTFLVVIPSLMTAFSIFASIKTYGRSIGGKGLFGWLKKLPWIDARFVIPFIGTIAFLPAGASGIFNSSPLINIEIYSLFWVEGHFQLSITTAILHTFSGVSYWLVPHLTGRIFTRKINNLALYQGFTWLIGMCFMYVSIYAVRLHSLKESLPWMTFQFVTISILVVSTILLIFIFVYLAFLAPKGMEEFPVEEVFNKVAKASLIFENWTLWLGLTVIILLLAYSIPLIDIIQNTNTRG